MIDGSDISRVIVDFLIREVLQSRRSGRYFYQAIQSCHGLGPSLKLVWGGPKVTIDSRDNEIVSAARISYHPRSPAAQQYSHYLR